MTVDATQPVYPPTTQTIVASAWGEAVSEHVVQRFVNEADRDAKWTAPPNGAMAFTDVGNQFSVWSAAENTWINLFSAAQSGVGIVAWGRDKTMQTRPGMLLVDGTIRTLDMTSATGLLLNGTDAYDPANGGDGFSSRSDGATLIYNTSQNPGLRMQRDGGASVNYIHFQNRSATATTAGSIAETGAAGAAVQYNATSDYRLKENDVPIIDGLDRVRRLRPIHFEWKSDDNNVYSDEGFFAHEVQEVVPSAVTGDKDAVYGEDDPIGAVGEIKPQQFEKAALIPVLTAAIKEMAVTIDALEARLAAAGI